MSTLNGYVIRNGETSLSKFAFLVDALTDEVIEELRSQDDNVIAGYFEQMGLVIAWVGHGDDSRLPEGMRPQFEPSEPEAIEAEA